MADKSLTVSAPEQVDSATTVASTRHALVQEAIRRAVGGKDGTNRCRTRVNQLGVESDIEAVYSWLQDRASNSPDTWRDYSSQTRRLLYWAWMKCPNPDSRLGVGKSLSSLTRQDLQAYREFLVRPDKSSVGPRKPFIVDGLINPHWRPLVSGLTTSHVEHVFIILKNLFQYLVDVGYLDGNPLAGTRAKNRGSMGEHHRRERKTTERKLDAEQWIAVLQAIEKLPRDTPVQRHHYERARFMFQAFFHLGARVGEIATHGMRWFVVKRINKDGKKEWAWNVKGKGGKEAEVPVNEALLAALVRYRISLGLPPLPFPNERTPMLMDNARRRGIGERQISRLVKEIFLMAAKILAKKSPEKSAQLKLASPHWIRHAMATFLAEKAKNMRELKAIQDLMRHDKLATTKIYIHESEEAMKMVSEWLSEVTNRR
jgi:site-specific recombinase XerD